MEHFKHPEDEIGLTEHLLKASEKVLEMRETKLNEEEIMDLLMPLPYSPGDNVYEDITMHLLEHLIMPFF